jgi:hypothetical protein
VPFVIAVGHHCQLLAQGKHLEMERSPASQEVDQGGEQRNEYCFHSGNATRAQTEKSTKSMGMEFLVGTGEIVFGPSFKRLHLSALHSAELPPGSICPVRLENPGSARTWAQKQS